MTTEYACCLNCGCAEFVSRVERKYHKGVKRAHHLWWPYFPAGQYERLLVISCANCANVRSKGKFCGEVA